KVLISTGSPSDTNVHLTYYIGDIHVFPDYYPTSTSISPYDTLLSGDVEFLFREKIQVKEKLLLNSIYLKKGELYSQQNYDDTNKKLGSLGIYKFVSIRFSKNPDNPRLLDFFIYLTPNKKNVLGFDFELNTANGNALGTGVSLNFRNRNFLRGAETFSVNIESGVEWAVNNPNITGINTVDLGLQFGLVLPKWVVPFQLKRNPQNAAQSIVNLEYNYQDRRIYYRNSIFSTSFGYDWRQSFSKRHIINPLSINFIRINEIRDSFQVILDDNPFLQESFTDQFIMGADYSFIYTSPVFLNGDSWFFRGTAEVAGNMASILDGLIRPNDTFTPFGNDYSQYLRLEGDIRYYKAVTRRSQLASRFYTGIGIAYGNSNELPYLKQFFAGGTTSMRAWILRELGPGAYIDTLVVNNPTVQPYQAAGFKLEANIEYRFDIFSAMEGALFLDAGNIWTIREDARGQEARFSTNFLDQLAVGAGFGVRFDFSYFVVRLDMAYKIRTPFPDEKTGSHFYYADRPFRVFRGQDVSYNLAIGYPF
ncbi:MAG: BamA/TamA family outer membrane protein, partial [Bacteroidota bacterium]